MNIGEKIIELRKKNGITQDELAKNVGVTPQAVSKWERSVASPDLFLIPELAKYFNVSADELLGLASPSTEGTKERQDGTSIPHLEARIEYLEHLLSMVMSGNTDEAFESTMARAKPLLSFDFTSMSETERSRWTVNRAEVLDNKKMRFKSVLVPHAVGKVYDPFIKNEKLELDAGGINRIMIRASSVAASNTKLQLEIHFKTKLDPTYNAAKKMVLTYTANNTTELVFPISNHPLWFGTVTAIRIDPVCQPAEYTKIEHIVFTDNTGDIKFMCDFSDPNADISDWEFINTTLVDRIGGIGCHHEPVDNVKLVYDPFVEINDLDFNIGKAKYIHIRMRTDLNDDPNKYNVYLGMHFKTEASPVYNKAKNIVVNYTAGCGMLDLYADMSQSAFWNGKLTGLRLDPIESRSATFEVELIEILESNPTVRSAGLLKDLEGKIDEMQDRIDDLDGRIDDLECRIDDLE